MPVITWWGHATATVSDSGTRVLTDPFLGARLAHLRRRRGPVPVAAAADADAAVVSHLHADHLHLPSLARLRRGTPVLVPRGAPRALPALGRLAARRGLELQEMAPGDTTRIGRLTLRAVPARHDGRRWALARAWSSESRRVQALGYVLRGDRTTYFAGDTDLFAGLAEAVGGCDVALLPVGGWGPTLGAGHLTPRRAAEAARLVGARAAVPVHFGTLWPVGLDAARPELFAEPGRRFVEEVRRLAPGTTARELRPGERAEFR
ncbi:hypothetical protein BIV57_08230 [Mangrovactinospora gilvigrisea]|uniref:Metallo-beta-lactamase domain-containing protein n=1 Tax=Mangrovactinospora gilvigrisea TaxID=1428644 RepID=A0A1J7C8U6_9ACTN|nr:MBL fold metallo-hydrolase [Mangrovactinospora gilvigrisea]OIV37960.1 hypothetical protein BIV57_08230 [Mangrovactinospora gilvigrisea]